MSQWCSDHETWDCQLHGLPWEHSPQAEAYWHGADLAEMEEALELEGRAGSSSSVTGELDVAGKVVGKRRHHKGTPVSKEQFRLRRKEAG